MRKMHASIPLAQQAYFGALGHVWLANGVATPGRFGKIRAVTQTVLAAATMENGTGAPAFPLTLAAGEVIDDIIFTSITKTSGDCYAITFPA